MAWSQDKAKQIIKQLLLQADSETSIGNEGAGQLFTEKAESLMLQYNIDISEIQSAISADAIPTFVNELGKTIISNPFNRVNAKTNLRKLWFEELAKLVAEAYSCKIDVNLSDATVSFIGYDLDREVATFMFLKLAEQANEFCVREMKLAKSQVGKPSGFDLKSRKRIEYPKVWMEDDVFIDSFHLGFREALAESYLKHQTEDLQKAQEVQTYFDDNKNISGYDYWYTYSYQNRPKENEINESAREVGKICGTNLSRKASKGITDLTVKNSTIQAQDTVFLLIDKSSSMDWSWSSDASKMQQAKDGAIDYAKRANEKGIAAGIITFGDESRIVSLPQKEVDAKFISNVNKIEANGGTILAPAIRIAHSRFLSRKAKRVICIVTDGQAQDRAAAITAANDAKRDGVEIYAVGVDDADIDFLNKLCSREGLGILVERNQLALTIGSMANNL